MSSQQERDDSTADLIRFCTMRPVADDRFAGEGPDWFGERVFGGVIVGQAISAAMQTVDRAPHSLHGYFLRPERAGQPVDARVERVRDGRTFSTRQVVLSQGDKDLFVALCSFHGGDIGDDYQMPMPRVPVPEEIEAVDDNAPPPFELRDLDPVLAEDGTYTSTRRYWARSGAAGDDLAAHIAIASFISDMTGTGFRPLSLDRWGEHADASIDHALWFHRRPRMDEWFLYDLHALINLDGRSTVRACVWDRAGQLLFSMAQELLIRPV